MMNSTLAASSKSRLARSSCARAPRDRWAIFAWSRVGTRVSGSDTGPSSNCSRVGDTASAKAARTSYSPSCWMARASCSADDNASACAKPSDSGNISRTNVVWEPQTARIRSTSPTALATRSRACIAGETVREVTRVDGVTGPVEGRVVADSAQDAELSATARSTYCVIIFASACSRLGRVETNAWGRVFLSKVSARCTPRASRRRVRLVGADRTFCASRATR